ncbi:hypothetical protein M0R45_025844 [Rubus argutus]|uniref:Uncharacterized protein n=1 Tax=Rubus argutus TaxID=59490 RepID=A0AAW1WY80_RUBAR
MSSKVVTPAAAGIETQRWAHGCIDVGGCWVERLAQAHGGASICSGVRHGSRAQALAVLVSMAGRWAEQSSKMERTPSVETERSPETVENDGGVERHG